MKKSITKFIRDHSHINYCEAIVHPDGEVEYASPSHTEALIRIYGKPRDILWQEMPIYDSPVVWLIVHTKCIPVWSNGYILPDDIRPTLRQLASLNKLVAAGLVSRNNMIMR